MERKTQPPRMFHRPISITIERVLPMPTERTLPRDTQMTANLKGNREMGELLIAEIKRQIKAHEFFAVTIEGVS